MTAQRPQRAYCHLEGRGCVPTAYEIGTSRLLYYPEHGFALRTPIAAWYERDQRGSRLAASFRDFSDPRCTTYASYLAEQQRREAFADPLLASIGETGYERDADAAATSLAEHDHSLEVRWAALGVAAGG